MKQTIQDVLDCIQDEGFERTFENNEFLDLDDPGFHVYRENYVLSKERLYDYIKREQNRMDVED